MHEGIDRVASLLISGRVRYALFDLDGTLYESSAGIEGQLRGAMVRQAALFLGIPVDEARQLLREYRVRYKSSVLGLQEHHGIEPVAFYEAVYGSLDTTAMERRPGLVEAVEDLAAFVRVGVFTNSNRTFTASTLERLGFDDELFDRVITVEDHGFIRKPEDEAYEMLYQDLDLSPDEVVMWDDIASSLEVMHRLGSHGVLVGNGLRPHPNFVDLHTNLEHVGAPPYVTAATHDVVDFISSLNCALQEGLRGV